MTLSRHVRRTPLLLAACGLALIAVRGATLAAEEPAHSAALDEAIIKAAHRHGVPEKLVRRIVMRESRYNPKARNHSYWGLMQISYPTAKSMGFTGSPAELLNPVVNLRYAVPYLANAFVIAGKSEDAAVRLYASGYYATAKARGLLSALRTADSTPLAAGTDEPAPVAVASAETAPADYGVFGALFGAGQQPQAAQAQVAYAAAGPQQGAQPQAAQSQQAAPASVALPEGKTSGDSVDLKPDRKGVLHAPKKWLRDGGVTAIARGEQSIEQVEANQRIAAADDRADHHRHAAAAKVTTFAALEAAPASAQAYAGAGTQDPRLLQADSQAAITQATSGQAVPQAAPQAAPPAAQAAAPDQGAADAEPSKKAHGRHAARRHHRETSGDAVAKASDLRPGEAAARDPQAAQAQPAAQPGPQTAEAAPASAPVDDPAPTRKQRTHHAKKKAAATVAAQQPDDGQQR